MRFKVGARVEYIGSYDPHKEKAFKVTGKSETIKGYVSVTLMNGKGRFEFSPAELKEVSDGNLQNQYR